MVPNRRESRVVFYGYDDGDPKEKRIVERCRVRCREVSDAAMVNCLDEPVSSDFHNDCASPVVVALCMGAILTV